MLTLHYRFLGPRMIYTSGVVRDLTVEESLEQLQDNKLTLVCEKVRRTCPSQCPLTQLKGHLLAQPEA